MPDPVEAPEYVENNYKRKAQGVFLLGADGQPADMNTGASYQLLENANGSGDPVEGVRGGTYIWTVTGTWNAASAIFEYRGPDGVTYLTALNSEGEPASLTANGSLGVVIGDNAVVRVRITGGPPSDMYSSIS